MDYDTQHQWVPEWKITGSDLVVSRSQLQKLLLEETPLLNVLVDIVIGFLRRNIWGIETIPKAGMYGTFQKTANI